MSGKLSSLSPVGYQMQPVVANLANKRKGEFNLNADETPQRQPKPLKKRTKDMLTLPTLSLTAAQVDRTSDRQNPRSQAKPSSEERKRIANLMVIKITMLTSQLWPELSNSPQRLLGKNAQELARRSKATYSEICLAAFYMKKMKTAEIKFLNNLGPFFYALKLAKIYLQDNPYTLNHWSKCSGLTKEEIYATELAILEKIGFNIYVNDSPGSEYQEHIREFNLDSSL